MNHSIHHARRIGPVGRPNPVAFIALVCCYTAFCFALCLGCAKQAVAGDVYKAPGVSGYGLVYYRVSETATAEAVRLLNRPLADRVAKLEAEVAELKREIASRPVPSEPPPSDQPAGPPDKAVPPEPEPDAIASAVDALLKKSCVRCHQGAKAAGKLDLSDPAIVSANRTAIFKAAYTGSMPPNGPPVADEDVHTLLEFLIADDE